MHRFNVVDALVIATFLIVVFVYLFRNPPKPRKPPRHPLPSHEPFNLFLRKVRRKADSWHF